MTEENALSVNNNSLIPSDFRSQTATPPAHSKGLRGFMDIVFEGKYFMRNKNEQISVQQQKLKNDINSAKTLHIDNENSGRTESKLTKKPLPAVHESIQKYHEKTTDELIRTDEESKNKMIEISEIPVNRTHSARSVKSLVKIVDSNNDNKIVINSSKQSSPTAIRIQNKRSVRSVKKSSQSQRSSSSQAKIHLLRSFSFRHKSTSVRCQKNVSPLLLSSCSQKQRVAAKKLKINSSFEDSSAPTKVLDGRENDKRDIEVVGLKVHKSSEILDQTMEVSFNEVSINHTLQQKGISSVSAKRNSVRHVDKTDAIIPKVDMSSYSLETTSCCQTMSSLAEERTDKTPQCHVPAAVTSTCTDLTNTTITTTTPNSTFQQHRIRSSIRCSRQTQRYQLQQNHHQSAVVTSIATPFKRGSVHLRDSRRRIAEMMRHRRSQLSIADSLKEAAHKKTSQQISDHAATRVKFLNEDKPTIMNKWIRIAKTTSAYGNLAFERTGNLVRHGYIEQNKSLRYGDDDLMNNDYNDDNKTESNQVQLCNREVCSARVQAADSSISSNQQCENNLYNVNEKVDICAYPTNQRVLDGLPYMDSDETEYLNDKENMFGKKTKIPTSKFIYDRCRQSNGFLVGHPLQELHMNRQILSNNPFQNVATMSLVNSNSAISDEREHNMNSSSIRSFSVKTVPLRNEPKNASQLPRMERICTNPKDRSVRGSVEEGLQSTSEIGAYSSAWFVPFNEQDQLSEFVTVNALHNCDKDEHHSTVASSNENKLVAINDDKHCYDEDLREDFHDHASCSNRTVPSLKHMDERGECDLVWVSQARGREVSAKVAVKEQISIQPRTQSSSSTNQTNFSANNIHFYSRPTEDLSKRYSRRDTEIKGHLRNNRKGYKFNEKEYVEAHTACDDHPSNGSIAAPSVHTSNSIVTVEKRVAEAECTVPMANGENAAQTSGTCSDRTTSDVEKILHNPIHRRPFQQFLEQQFCAENINFYVAVEEYRAIPDSEMEKRSKVARQIYERHFTANSIEPVNIDNSTSKSIRDAVSAQQFSAQLYDVAQYQIFHLLKYDCWPRYLRAGGVAPTFDDQATGEEHPGPSTQPVHSSQLSPLLSNQHRSALSSGSNASQAGATVISTPAISNTNTNSPNRSKQAASEMVCTRFCTLMHNEIATSEQIPLNDPTESVGKWTSSMASRRGMDPRATEAVDAQSLSTIDPARQAMDALNNRCVCLMPVLHFAIEILAPNASTKTGSAASNSRIVLLRARHGLSSGAILRSVLAKFSVDYDTCIVVLSGTLEVIASHISVGTIGARCVTVMTQQQFQERQHSPKRDTLKDAPVLAHFLSPDANVPFYQHGDVAFFEFPADLDPRTGKMSAARSFSNAKTEHGSGLLKFVRKASQAVTSREQPDTVASSSSSVHHSHHHSGHNQHSSSMTSAYAEKIRRKSVGTFQRTASAAAASDIPYCGENNITDEQQYAKETWKRPETGGVSSEPSAGVGSTVQTPSDGRGRVYELPEFLRKDNSIDSSSSNAKLRFRTESVGANSGVNGSTARIPPIYASAVPSEKKDLTPSEVEKTIVWQRADYV